MKKRTVSAVVGASAVSVLMPLTLLQVTSAGAVGRVNQPDQTGAITIQSWLYAVPSENVMSATIWDCFKITGAITDEGGGPTWADDASYHAPNAMTSGGVSAASEECSDKVPAGGFILVPPPEAGQYQFAQYTAAPGSPGGLSTIYAVHTLVAQKGDIDIQFAATYNMTNSPVPVKLPNGTTVDVQPLTTGPEGSWVITGGTGAYAGLQGSGTSFANAENTFPWINHTERGSVWWDGAH
ncbi:MAG TPA: hypothetical protein VEJ84_14015 [Acidimicrobiales bacterium]|nr:hypothetical protein [Acidimicrobiales bacterium]